VRGPKPPPIVLTPTQLDALQRLKRRQRSPQRLVRRVRIILEAASGTNNAQIAQLLGIDRGQVRTWRKRWLESAPRLQEVAEREEKEKAGDGESSSSSSSSSSALITAVIEEVLADEPRSGTPPIFSAEQVVRIVALACEDPRDCGRPVTHWTTPELADEAVKRGIVRSVSARSVGRFLGRGGSQASSRSLLAQQ
jgi:putative transposase